MSVCLKKETLLAFADSELPSGEMESAERHTRACTACQKELQSIRATSANVNALLSSLAQNDAPNVEEHLVVRIRYSGANRQLRWAAVASLSVLAAAILLSVMIRRPHPAPAQNVAKIVTPAPERLVQKSENLVAAVSKPAQVVPAKTSVKVREFQALDDGEPMQTGMIYRVSLPASSSTNAVLPQSAKRIPAEVIVDEFGKVRAIRFLQ